MIEKVNNRGHQEVSFNNEGDIPLILKNQSQSTNLSVVIDRTFFAVHVNSIARIFTEPTQHHAEGFQIRESDTGK